MSTPSAPPPLPAPAYPTPGYPAPNPQHPTAPGYAPNNAVPARPSQSRTLAVTSAIIGVVIIVWQLFAQLLGAMLLRTNGSGAFQMFNFVSGFLLVALAIIAIVPGVISAVRSSNGRLLAGMGIAVGAYVLVQVLGGMASAAIMRGF